MNAQRAMSAFVSIHASYSITLSESLELVGAFIAQCHCCTDTSIRYLTYGLRYDSLTILELCCVDMSIGILWIT